MDNNQMNNMNQPTPKKFNYVMGFGIVAVISAVIFFATTTLSSVFKSQGAASIPLASFLSSMGIMASIVALILGSVIVLVMGLSKK